MIFHILPNRQKLKKIGIVSMECNPTKHKNLKCLLFIGILFLQKSHSATTSEDAEEYVGREDILENIVIHESSRNIETSTIRLEGKFISFSSNTYKCMS